MSTVTSGFPRRVRTAAPIVGALAVFASLGIVLVSGMSTSSARIAATTESTGFLTAGTVVLAAATDDVALFFDADGLYPGVEVTGCVAIRYTGSAPADLRLTASPDGGSGLDQFIDLELVEIPGGVCPDTGAPGDATTTNGTTNGTTNRPGNDAGQPLFDGTLRAFWQTHRSYDTGLPVARLETGDLIAVMATATVVDDNRAAGRDTELTFTFEGRPA